MKGKKLNTPITYKILLTLGVVGFNLVYVEDISYFWLSLYLWINIGFFMLLELYQNRKTRNMITLAHFVTLMFFTSKNMKLSLIFVSVFIIERIKFNIWGFLIIGFFMTISSFIILNLQQGFFYLYSVTTYFTAIYFQNLYKIKIKKLENLESKERKELLRVKTNNKRTLEKSKQNIKLARLEERNELGRKMHDKVGHTIAGSLLRLEAVKIVMNVDKEKGEEMLDEVINNLRNGMADIRDIIHKTAPLKEEIGINRIRNVLAEKLNNTEINFDVTVDGDLSIITYSLWNTIEEFVVEMSTNSIKYSNCSKMSFHMNIMHKMIKIQFSDNGKGVDKVIKGYGLNKIDEEIASLGGKFILDGTNGFSGVILINRG
ncbi:MAG: sensor histidine kinase [Sarcina sp.]